MPLSDENVREILRIIDQSPLREIRVETDGFSLHVVVDGSGPEASPPEPAQPPEPTPPPEPVRRVDLATIEAPMLGMFWAADGPSQQPFVQVGSRVSEDTIVCIIEVMKMMNSVPAGVGGTIVEVCAENAALVQEGEALFRVDPS
jgi:acetyl-CoA carboxylase biotin carboxyl carrier protein